MQHTSIISGSSMAVLIGVALFIGSWFMPIGFGAKIFFAIVGALSFLDLQH